MSILIFVLVLIVLFLLVGGLYLKGPDLSAFDHASDPEASVSFPGVDGPSDAHIATVKEVQAFGAQAQRLSRAERLIVMREYMDSQGARRELASQFRSVDAGGVPAEWVLAPGADPGRRVLYIHGGAFIAGSPLSHRSITDCYSKMCNAAVLAIDYRLMPENSRIAGVEDCRTAYRWILENGPEGPQPLEHLVVSGDSAGGNLTLSLSAWVRDEGLRLPEAVVAFSPTVDGTFASPSIRNNLETDIMLGPLFSILYKIPGPIRRWLFVLENRMHPANPVVSPIYSDSSGLPPTLIQVSEAEMLLDDAYRYVNKARASGSRAVAQTWAHMLHVWQIFYPEVPEAVEAMQEVRKFIDSTRTPD